MRPQRYCKSGWPQENDAVSFFFCFVRMTLTLNRRIPIQYHLRSATRALTQFSGSAGASGAERYGTGVRRATTAWHASVHPRANATVSARSWYVRLGVIRVNPPPGCATHVVTARRSITPIKPCTEAALLTRVSSAAWEMVTWPWR